MTIRQVTYDQSEGVLGAKPLTSEFGRPNSVLAATLHVALRAPAGKKGRTAGIQKDAVRTASSGNYHSVQYSDSNCLNVPFD